MIEENVIQEDSSPYARAKVRPKRGLGSAITRQRRVQAEELQRKVEERKAKEKRAILAEMERLRQRGQQQDHRSDNWAANLLRSTVSGQTAVLRSMGFNQAVTSSIVKAPHVTAYTDFKKIVVQWPESTIPNRLDRTATLDIVAQMKGVMQHEMGHIRFTTPWQQVIAVAPPSGKHPMGTLFTCWNMLEDERMESLVVEAVPRIANYFGTMVANVCLNGSNLPLEQTWLMLAGRSYLPKAVLRKSYTLFDQFCDDQGIPNGAITWFNLVQDFKSADTEAKIMKATEAAYEFIQQVRATMPQIDHSQQQQNDVDPADTSRGPGSILDLFDETPPSPGKGKPGESGSGEGQPGGTGAGLPSDYDERIAQPPTPSPGKGKGEKASEGEDAEGEGEGGEGEGEGGGKQQKKSTQPGQSNHGDGSSRFVDEGSLEEALEDALEGFTSETRKDRDLLDAIRNANFSSDREGLEEYPHEGEAMSPELTARAMFTAQGIEKALNSFVTDAAPTWKNHQERGIVDPLAYRTKNVGDRDFRRHMEDYGATALNVHVSMLCDVSGSMSGGWGRGGDGVAPIIALSESLYAMGIACRNLGIGATYTLWSSDKQNYRVWVNGEPTPTLWPCMGGTDPLQALDDLDTHNPEGADNHLVVIFTDGAWASNFPSLMRWQQPGRTIILVRYGSYEGEMQKDMGADKHIQINSVSQLPGHLTQALIEVLSDGGGW